MADREKVIKGLECCTIPGNCGTCPWYPSDKAEEGCIRTLMKGTLTLLKAQEARVMARWEYKHRHRKSYRQYTGFDSIGEIHTITSRKRQKGKNRIAQTAEHKRQRALWIIVRDVVRK